MSHRSLKSLRPILWLSCLVTLSLLGCSPDFEDDVCSNDTDCFDDEQCQDERCVVVANACGGNEVFDAEPGDPCGPCDLDELVCSSTNESLVCDGQTACPQFHLTQNPATDVDATSARVSAELASLPLDADLEEHGFCWSNTTATPTMDDQCLAVTPLADEGATFEATLSDLDEEMRYFVRAYGVVGDDDPHFSNEISFTTTSAGPR